MNETSRPIRVEKQNSKGVILIQLGILIAIPLLLAISVLPFFIGIMGEINFEAGLEGE